MANWISLARDKSDKPLVSAMNGGTVEKSLNSDSKNDLIEFLKRFSGAGTFLVAKPDGSESEVEAIDLLPQSDSSDSDDTNDTPDATWFQFFRNGDGQPIVVAMNETNGVESYKGNLRQALIDFLVRHSGANTFQIAPASASIPQGIPEWKPPTPTPTPPKPSGHRVMLEIGHGPGVPFDPGAIAHDNKTTEHELNIIAANAARNVLVAAGVDCTVIDTPGSLRILGLKASGFDVFCSVHHNALTRGQNKAQRSEAFSHATKGDKPDQELASMISAEMSKTLGLIDGGAKQANLGVLSGAEDTNVRAAVLAEVYFIDFVGGTVKGKSFPKPDLKTSSSHGGEAIGRAIVDWLKKNP
jgi:N-acetylmuramoyl-L-alanine amidase